MNALAILSEHMYKKFDVNRLIFRVVNREEKLHINIVSVIYLL